MALPPAPLFSRQAARNSHGRADGIIGISPFFWSRFIAETRRFVDLSHLECCREIAKNPLLRGDSGKSGGTAWDAAPAASSAVAEVGSHGQVSGQHRYSAQSLAVLIASGLTQIFCFRRAPEVAGRGFSSMRKIIFRPTATKTATRPK
jgi:hypothetical protein